jgi:glycine/D-amino acid oxidase-like deaminating enzyme
MSSLSEAKANGVTILQNAAVKRISLRHGMVKGFLTSEGELASSVVIDAAGVCQ